MIDPPAAAQIVSTPAATAGWLSPSAVLGVITIIGGVFYWLVRWSFKQDKRIDKLEDSRQTTKACEQHRQQEAAKLADLGKQLAVLIERWNNLADQLSQVHSMVAALYERAEMTPPSRPRPSTNPKGRMPPSRGEP